MAKFYLVGDIKNNDLWLVDTENSAVTRVFVGDDDSIFGSALNAFADHSGTVTLGSSQVEMTPEEVARSIYQSAMQGMAVSNVPVCIASGGAVGDQTVARRDDGGDGDVRLDDDSD